MSTKRTFLICLGAYLTGWVIAQSFFNRLWRLALAQQVDGERQKWLAEVASAVCDELAKRDRGRGRHGYGEVLVTDRERIIAEFNAAITAWAEGQDIIGNLPTRGALDVVREQAEQIIGQPCIARYVDDGRAIEVQTPVVKRA